MDFFFPGEKVVDNSSEKLLGVGGLGGLYPAVRKYAQCHHNGSNYEHGDKVSIQNIMIWIGDTA